MQALDLAKEQLWVCLEIIYQDLVITIQQKEIQQAQPLNTQWALEEDQKVEWVEKILSLDQANIIQKLIMQKRI